MLLLFNYLWLGICSSLIQMFERFGMMAFLSWPDVWSAVITSQRRQRYNCFCSGYTDYARSRISLSENNTFYYASAFRRRRHYVFGLSVRPSVRPSVRSLKYPLLTCTWVRWSTRPTVTVLRHVRLSVRPSVRLSVRPSREVSGHLPENAWREWPEI